MSADTPSPSALKLTLAAKRAREQTVHLLAADPVAIVGMGCRVPGGGDSPQKLWELLRDGVDAVRDVPGDRWDSAAWYDPDISAVGKILTQQAGFLERIDGFDSPYFGIPPREADRMDPQQRLFLEVALEALDDAGLTRERLRGSRAGVFIASYHNDYTHLQYGDLDAVDPRTLTGTLHSVLANRLSHFLDLHGPSLSVDTACSSSLVAIHLACQSLRFAESDIAVAGGVSLIVGPELMVAMSKVGFMSPDGRCKTFDAAANGFGRGEGCGIVVLKRLSDAIADGDQVLAMVRGSAVNQDGHSTLLAAPHGPAQESLIKAALASAQLTPDRIGFVEAHGTGTALGDPIEVEAIAATLGRVANAGPCFLGSVKANLGHLEAAAGVTGLIKAVLSLRHESIPPQIHFSKLNPHISLEGTRLSVPTGRTPWPAGATPRCAGISSFGVGGTNAHVIVEEAPRLPGEAGGAGSSAEADQAVQILTLSAQSPAALADLARHWVGFLGASSATLADVCFTATQRRHHYDYRLATLGRSKLELAKRLGAHLEGTGSAVVSGSRSHVAPPRVVFVFSGQGPQWYGMGRELLAAEPVFREKLTECEAVFAAQCGWALLAELARPEDSSRLDQTEIAQPALFAIQVALAALWQSWGVVPAAIVGHSVGEIAALHVAGVLDLQTAVRVVWHRGRLMQQATGSGRMASVGIGESAASALLRPYGARLSIGAVNSPRSTVLSGESEALAEALAELDRQGVSHRALPVKYAFHSAQMAPFERRLAAELQGVRGLRPAVDFYSTVTGDRADDLVFDGAYFGRNVSSAVRFAPAIAAMVRDGCNVFLEIAPHPVLASAIAECVGEQQPGPVVAASLRRGQPERDTMLLACTSLYAAGCDPDWSAIQGPDGRVVTLPAYPWQRKRHWLRKRPSQPQAREHDPLGHPLLGARIDLAAIDQQVFPAESSGGREWLAHHRIFGHHLVPATAMLELLVSAARRVLGSARVRLESFALQRPLLLGEEGASRWQVVATRVDGGPLELTLYERNVAADGQRVLEWRSVASATALVNEESAVGAGLGESSRSHTSLEAQAIYARFNELQVEFGESFRCLRSVEHSEGTAQAVIELPPSLIAEAGKYAIHPVLLDAALQVCSLAAPRGAQGEVPARVFLPLGAERVTLQHGIYTRLRARAVVKQREDGSSLSADVLLATESGTLVGMLEGVAFAPANASQFESLQPSGGERAFEVRWRVAREAPVGAAPARRPWLIFCDDGGVADAVAVKLQAHGGRCYRIYRGPEFAATGPDTWKIDPASPEHFERLLAVPELRGAAVALEVLHCWSLDLESYGMDTGAALAGHADAQDLLASGSVLHLTQALVRSSSNAASGLWLVTDRAQVVTGKEPAEALRPCGAGVWGLAGTIAIEHPELHVSVLDLDASERNCVESLLAELRGTGLSRLALRDGRRWVPELHRYRGPAPHLAKAERTKHLEVVNPGTLDGLGLRPSLRTPLLPGQVRLKVHAAGLNFRDVLLTLGMYPGTGVALGAECAGVIVEVSSAVTGFKTGDRVYGYVTASLATEATAWASHIAHLPQDTEMEVAAGLGVAYLTALYGLYRLANLAGGQRVLIHAAAGGVGLAAVELARQRGAEVFATAGSAEKREFLKRRGVAHVFDSRSLDFAEQVLLASGGRGVDIVLNSLAGDFIPTSLRTVARGGCFLELGKRDVWSAEAIAKERPDVRYFVYDLGSEADRDRTLLPPMFAQIAAGLAAGTLQPLPVKVFELDAATEAMRYMAQARHIGKIVLRVAGAEDPSGAFVSDRGTYWVTGGFGALGLETARWLVGNGARNLVLTGRNLPGARVRESLQGLEEQGARIRCFAADAADRDAMIRVVESVRLEGPPLRGVIHAAGALHDAVLLHQRWDEAREVLRGKAHGAWLLHELTREDPLDFFVLYSAAGVLLGASGQGLYAAANAQLDALAQARRRDGRPALSVAWGAWSGTGMAATATAAGNRDVWTQRGLGKLDAVTGFAELTRLLRDAVPSAAVISIDWERFLAQLPVGVDREFFASLTSSAAGTPKLASGAAVSALPVVSVAERLRALPAGQRRQALLAHLTTQALQVLDLDASTSLDPRAALKDSGLDSLMAVELRNALNRHAPQPLPATLLFDYPTLETLATYLGKRWELEPERSVASQPEATPGSSVAQALPDMSDAEAEALLRAELDELQTGRAS